MIPTDSILEQLIDDLILHLLIYKKININPYL